MICDWCNKRVDSLIEDVDAFGDKYNICSKCKDAKNNHKCIKCGDIISDDIAMKGLCTKCLQVEVYKKAKKNQEVAMGLGELEPSVEITDKEYEDWMLLSKSFKFSDMQRSHELRYVWVLVKLNSVGIYDNNIINENFKDIEKLLDRRLRDLKGVHCRMLIAYSPELRKAVKKLGKDIIDFEGNTYILKMDSLE